MILGVDVGGTFTDAVLLDGRAGGHRQGAHHAAGPVRGGGRRRREALAAAGAQAGDVERFVHGMTVGTNALLEGKVATTALLATEGFVDLEELGRQARADLYRLCAGHPPPLVPAELRVPVPERCGPERRPARLEEDELRMALDELDAESVAICLLWGFRHPEHERRAAELAGRPSPTPTSPPPTRPPACSASTSAAPPRSSTPPSPPAARLPRAATRARPRRGGLPAPEVMLSSGGTATRRLPPGTAPGRCCRGPRAAPSAPRRCPSWPARRRGRARHGRHLVRRVGALDGPAAVSGGREVGGRALALPMVDVHTVGAGGGSDRLARRRRRPARRAHAPPGPTPGPPATAAAARSRRSPTRTCCSATSTRTRRSRAACELDREAARARGRRLGDELGLTWRRRPPASSRVANTEMAQAVRVVTVERGVDPRDLAMVAFGGAGPLHAAAIADELGMTRVVAPVACGVLSALGLVVSERRRDVVESVLLAGDDADGRRASPRSSRGSASAAARRWTPPTPSCARPTSCATRARPSSCQSRASSSPIRPSCAATSTPPTRSATATTTRTPSSSS